MAVFALNNQLIFPPVQMAEPDGLLAMGGDLSEQRLLLAYKSGIFPWYDGDIPLWWCPDPRFVLFPKELVISKSMQQVIRRNHFRFTANTSFETVIHHCKTSLRPGQQGTWITDAVEQAYVNLHKKGVAHSAEAWQNNELVGGLYGIKIGRVFFGESMFAKVSNASKFAFIMYTQQLASEGIELIDCQVYTPHLESLGARMMPRQWFINQLSSLL